MAYMHKTTFDILQGGITDKISVTLLQDSDDYFEIDDAIAVPVQTLNRKGYLTGGCCSGHPFLYRGSKADTEWSKAHMDELLTMSSEEMSRIVKEKAIDVFTQQNYCDIGFMHGITLPSLPPGFESTHKQITEPNANTIRSLHISKQYDSSADALAFMREVLDTMEQLQQWALELPDNRG